MPPDGQRQGKWNEKEHRAMFTFVHSRREEILRYLETNFVEKLRSNKRMFFIQMANAIRSKSVTQCKSRYQKQELSLLRTLDIPAYLMDSFYAQRGMSAVDVQKFQSCAPTETSIAFNKRLLTDESMNASIYTVKELRDVLYAEFMPQIASQSIRTQMEKFISILPDEGECRAESPSFCHNSISLMVPALGVSFINAGFKADSFFEE